jgi:carboxyl-terminal processing protease
MMKSYRPVLLFFAALLLMPGSARAQSIKAERDRMKRMLDNVSKTVAENFYDPEMHGLNWQALTDQARERIVTANSAGEMTTAIFSLVQKLEDSHTFYVPPQLAADIKFGFEAKAYGDAIRIYEIKKGGAADKAGLRVGDQIMGLNGLQASRETIDFMLLFLRRLRPVAKLQMIIARGDEAPREITLPADVKQRPLVEDWTKIDSIWKYIREAENEREDFRYQRLDGDVGYVFSPGFYGSADFLSSLVGKIKNSRAVIVDLRGNLGGAQDSLEHFAGFFEEESSEIAQVVSRKKTETMKTRPHKPYLGGPMFILVDSQTASAAEIFARHFQQTGRAVIVGDRTSGRVTGARYFDMQFGAQDVVFYGVNVAVMRAIFPGGEELEKRGVTPDQTCIPTAEDLVADRDPCFDLAVRLAKEKLGTAGKTPGDGTGRKN